MNSPPTGSRSLLRIDALFSLRSFLIGVVPLLAVLAVMGGSLAAALQMLLVSTICTSCCLDNARCTMTVLRAVTDEAKELTTRRIRTTSNGISPISSYFR
jgi:hypothetical protein